MNNLSLILDPLNVPSIISAKLWIKDGSRADKTNQKGAHQLLGSVLSRGCGPFNSVEIADLVEGCGAGLRCETYEDGILISLKCIDNDVFRLLPILGWMIKEPHLDPGQISLEQDLTLQALQRQKENPFHQAFDGWRQLAYGTGPYGHDPLGLSSDIKSLEQDKLRSLSETLSDRTAVLAISGSIQKDIKEKVINMEPFMFIKDRPIKKQSITSKFFSSKKEIKPHLNIILQKENTNQVVIMLGQSTIPHGHKDDLALRLLASHMGSGMSSYLFRQLREKHGVAYDVGVHHPVRELEAPFMFHASTTEEKALISLQLLKESWWKLSEKTITEDELVLAKAKFRGRIAHNSQTASQRAERYTQLRAFGLEVDLDIKSLALMESITSEDIMNVAKTYLNNPLLSLCGPSASLKKLSQNWIE